MVAVAVAVAVAVVVVVVVVAVAVASAVVVVVKLLRRHPERSEGSRRTLTAPTARPFQPTLFARCRCLFFSLYAVILICFAAAFSLEPLLPRT
ncbi:hypothetical protein HDF10_001390 [Edaphobacter lichenicola]|uniref:Uncharacterized protein n=1 Tax=Tunturiibacter lichenicola TaxID=2051959 RepID=A0A7W8N4Y8_9BACT|nr:hypothetical protein [Edaphobacter lichenicola]